MTARSLYALLLGALFLLSTELVAAKDRAPFNLKPGRIISMTPSVTETIFALGGEATLIAVTSYCDYPAAARELPSIGGYVDPNFEVIVGLNPDYIITLENDDLERKLSTLGLNVVSIKNESISDIFASIQTIGELISRTQEAHALIAAMRRRLALAQEHLESLPDTARPRVMVAVSGSPGEQQRSIFVAGRDTIFDEVIKRAGGRNALSSHTGYPALSAEGIVALNPDIIIDLLSQVAPADDSLPLRSFWASLPGLVALKNGQVYPLSDSNLNRPGPRIVDTIERFTTLINRKNS